MFRHCRALVTFQTAVLDINGRRFDPKVKRGSLVRHSKSGDLVAPTSCVWTDLCGSGISVCRFLFDRNRNTLANCSLKYEFAPKQFDYQQISITRKYMSAQRSNLDFLKEMKTSISSITAWRAPVTSYCNP